MGYIHELIGAIREWQVKVADCNAAEDLAKREGWDVANATRMHRNERDNAARVVTGNDHTNKAFTAYVALVDHLETLTSEYNGLRAELMSVHNVARIGKVDALEALKSIETRTHKVLSGE